MRSLIVAAAALVLLTGCMSHTRTITTTNGSATVTTSNDNKTVTVRSSQGTFTEGKNAVNPASLGLPVYPGAAQSQVGYSAASKESNGSVVVMTTNDPFDKVYGWYKAQMPAGSEQMHMTSQNSSIAVFQEGKTGDKEEKAVSITNDGKGMTSIMLTVSSKS
jgi:hypothetical protein